MRLGKKQSKRDIGNGQIPRRIGRQSHSIEKVIYWNYTTEKGRKKKII